MPRSKSAKQISPVLFWAPRALGIAYILFLSMFALDIFGQGYSFWETVVGLFMHLIPSFILTIIIIISWRYELVGAILFTLAGLFYIVNASLNVPWYLALSWSLTIAGPAILTGILFGINWGRKRKKIR